MKKAIYILACAVLLQTIWIYSLTLTMATIHKRQVPLSQPEFTHALLLEIRDGCMNRDPLADCIIAAYHRAGVPIENALDQYPDLAKL